MDEFSSFSVRTWQVISSRIEDSMPDTEIKKSFEKHMQGYFDRIRRCNVYYATLNVLRRQHEEYQIAAEFAPAFWGAVHYDFQMGLITDIVAFLGDDSASLAVYLPKVLTNKNTIFTRHFFHTLKEERTGEIKEEEWQNAKTNVEAFQICQQKLEECAPLLPLLKAARDKVYCHLDKKSLSIEDCNNDIFEKITYDEIRKCLDNIGYVIQTLNALYTNVSSAVEYTNQDDVNGLLNVCNTYSKYSEQISEFRAKDFRKEFEKHWKE